MPRGSLTIVGTGISLGQMTLEACSHIETAEKVFYLVADPLTVDWIKSRNQSAEDLYPFYKTDRDRLTTYFLMTDEILNQVRQGKNVCAAFYGHPGVFVFPSHEAVLRARSEGYEAKMLAAVSAEDCLFADLGIDPGRAGCQSYEATDFLVHGRRIDNSCALILWQVGIVGEIYNKLGAKKNIDVLCSRLSNFYPKNHKIVIYEASHYIVCDPIVVPIELHSLPFCNLTPISTLYVPPCQKPDIDTEVALALEMPESFMKRRASSESFYDPYDPKPYAVRV